MSRANRISTPLVIANVLMLCAAAGLSAVIHQRGYHLTKLPIQAENDEKFHTLPGEYPSWMRVGSDRQESAEGVEELGTSNYLSRVYVERGALEGESPHVVDMHIAYYTGMIDTVPHVPERCLVGGGWQQGGVPQLVDVPLPFDNIYPDPTADPETHGGTIYKMRSLHTYNNERLPRGVEELQIRVTPFVDNAGNRLYAGYFFVANGDSVPSAEDIRLRAFRLEDDYAFYCKFQFTSRTVESAEELAGVVAGMLSEMFPDLMRRVPDWVEVREGRYPPDRERTSDRAGA
jgi:hypothetical protein